MPVAIRRLSPATRTMKNSSRLLAKIARKRARSSSGTSGSAASCEHPLVELQPGDLAVEEAVALQGAVGLVDLRRRPGRAATNRPLAARGWWVRVSVAAALAMDTR